MTYSPEYYKKNKAQLYLSQRKWVEKNKEEIKIYQKTYREAHKDKMKVYQAAYRTQQKRRKAVIKKMRSSTMLGRFKANCLQILYLIEKENGCGRSMFRRNLDMSSQTITKCLTSLRKRELISWIVEKKKFYLTKKGEFALIKLNIYTPSKNQEGEE